jgi:hypothetical protein
VTYHTCEPGTGKEMGASERKLTTAGIHETDRTEVRSPMNEGNGGEDRACTEQSKQ